MVTWADDALWVGGAIAQRLDETVTDKVLAGGLRAVLHADDWRPGTRLPTAQAPAAVVVLRNMQPEPRNALAKGSAVSQQWVVVLVFATLAADPARGAHAAGAHLARTVAALDGWTPPGSHRPLVWVAGPGPTYGPTLSYFPLAFAHLVKTA